MKELSKDKIIKTETVFNKIDYDKPITFGEIDIELQPDDVIIHNWEEAYYGSDSGMDAHWSMVIHRDRLETDEEFEKRQEDLKKMSGGLKKKRYEHYLKLKAEFEGDEKH